MPNLLFSENVMFNENTLPGCNSHKKRQDVLKIDLDRQDFVGRGIAVLDLKKS